MWKIFRDVVDTDRTIYLILLSILTQEKNFFSITYFIFDPSTLNQHKILPHSLRQLLPPFQFWISIFFFAAWPLSTYRQ
jgi:hypothetical protein